MLNNKGTGKEADNYGIGAVLYEFLHGETPFYSDDPEELKENIKSGKLRFGKHISETAKSLISGLMERNPKKRLGYKSKEEIKNHLFFKGLDWRALYEKRIEAPFKKESFESDDEGEGYGQPKKNKFTDTDYDEHNYKVNRVLNFSFTR